MRLFFAVELPGPVRAALGRLRGDDRDYRWVDPTGMHITLAFLGEQPADRLDALERIGEHAAGASQRGVLRLDQAGSFGSRRAPRVLWVGLGGEIDRLRALQARLSDGLRAGAFPVEEREFNPHVTLARRRQTAAGPAPTGWPPEVEPAQFPMHELTLFESRLSPRGSTYVGVRGFQVGNGCPA